MLKHTTKYSSWEDISNHRNWRRNQISILFLSFMLFFHWKVKYKNVYNGFHKRTENNWNFRSSRLGVFCKKRVLRNFAKFTGKLLRQSFFFNKFVGLIKLQALSLAFLKKKLWHRSFTVNFAKCLRTFFLVEYLRWLLLGPFLGCQWMRHFSRKRMNLGWI